MVAVGEAFELTAADNRHGIGSDAAGGVGWTSMPERSPNSAATGRSPAGPSAA
ncbi:hypothetical protein [Dactylosporangium sp. NPDC051541]|uniref:hypothetical protein n=1 Tax=Dactylosporangium sp. NPDC051541 TaxID=3363977 RepID=UPI003799AD46